MSKTKRSKSSRRCIYKKEWEAEKPWVRAGKDEKRAFCTICCREITVNHGGWNDITRHEATGRHQKAAKATQGAAAELTSSLRMWVPPLRLLSASIWQVVQQRQVESYHRVEEFVSVVLELVPDLLSTEEKTELLLGLRTKFLLELCHDQPSMTRQMIQPHLERVSRIAESSFSDGEMDQTVDDAVRNFVDLIQALVKSPEYRRHYFQDTYPLHYGQRFDTALQSLVEEFLSRLEMLLPVPSFYQVADWFDESPWILEDCLQMVHDPKHFQKFFLLCKDLTHLKSDSSSPPIVTNTILSTLSDSPNVQGVLIASGKSDNSLATPHESPSQNESNQPGDSNDEDWSGDVDEGDPQRDSDEGQNDASQHNQQSDPEQCSQTSFSETELNATNGLNGAVDQIVNCENKGKDPPSTREENVLSPTVQSSLHKVAVYPAKTHYGAFRCTKCGKVYLSKGWLNRHKKIHKQMSSDFEKAVKNKTKEKDPPSTGEENALSTSVQTNVDKETVNPERTEDGALRCTECGKVYLFENSFERHKKSHAVEKNVSRQSGTATTAHNQPDRQTARDKTPRLYACSKCDKIYQKKISLAEHERIHTGERPYECSYCGRTFRLKCILTEHIRTHTGQRPYECSICGKRFKQSTSLVAHKRIHTGEKPYLCSFCGKGFPSSGACLIHTRTHTGERPYKCEFCEKAFTMSCHLKIHRRLHTNEKPYPCTLCSKRFRMQVQWKRHMRTHTGEKPYECLACGKKFSVQYNMKVHSRVHK
ncbi:zinc finger protein ZFP2-like [Engraulis encrasicolus]|uniref:zinc finger protein ZFP2-like n=1 Tax=Engraulis encrasicolus TaxID=184585 RepID=UPI002FD5899E